MKKTLSIIMLAIIGVILIYGTVCLYRGDFEGAFATFPFLFVYYLWAAAMKSRKKREETDDQDSSDPTR